MRALTRRAAGPVLVAVVTLPLAGCAFERAVSERVVAIARGAS